MTPTCDSEFFTAIRIATDLREPQRHQQLCARAISAVRRQRGRTSFQRMGWVRRADHRGITELNPDVPAWTNAWNTNPTPPIRTEPADENLETLAAYRQRINDSRRGYGSHSSWRAIGIGFGGWERIEVSAESRAYK